MEGLNELLKLIAEKLGVGLDIVANNFPKYMEEFGKYLMVTNIPFALFLGFISAMLFFSICMITRITICEEMQIHKTIKRTVVIISIVLCILPSAFEYIRYKTSPTICIIEEGIRLLK